MKKLILCAWLAAAGLSTAGTACISFVYQPLTPLGTEQDADPIIARIPVIINAVPEELIRYISAKNKLLQREDAFAEDSNLLSCVGVTVSANHLSENEGYEVRLDLSKMVGTKELERYAVTPEKVVQLAVKCIRDTISVGSGSPPWKIRVIPQKPGDRQWEKYEGIIRPTGPK